MSLKEIVEVNISRETTGVAVAAFNVPLLLSTFTTDKNHSSFFKSKKLSELEIAYGRRFYKL